MEKPKASPRSHQRRVSIFLNLDRSEEALLYERLCSEPANAGRAALLKTLALRGLLVTGLAGLHKHSGDELSVLGSLLGLAREPTHPSPVEHVDAARKSRPMGDFLGEN